MKVQHQIMARPWRLPTARSHCVMRGRDLHDAGAELFVHIARQPITGSGGRSAAAATSLPIRWRSACPGNHRPRLRHGLRPRGGDHDDELEPSASGVADVPHGAVGLQVLDTPGRTPPIAALGPSSPGACRGRSGPCKGRTKVSTTTCDSFVHGEVLRAQSHESPAGASGG